MPQNPSDKGKKKLTPEDHYLKYGSWSAAIRGLEREGLKPREISDALGKSYQHVHNVLNRELKRGPRI